MRNQLCISILATTWCLLSGASFSATKNQELDWSDHQIALWQSFDVPIAMGNGTVPQAINDLGGVTGYYADSAGLFHGFLRNITGKIVTFDAPGAGMPIVEPIPFGNGTIPTGINNRGEIVGYFTDTAGNYHGFLRSAAGNFTIIDDPSASGSPLATMVLAVNDSGAMVGLYFDTHQNFHGFLHEPDGSFTTIDGPGNFVTTCLHINEEGEVGCQGADPAIVFHSLLRYPNGKILTYDAPGAGTGADLGTFVGFAQALNVEGQIVGEYADANNGYHGYIRNPNGKFVEFTVPGGGTSGAAGTYPASLNFWGTVIGWAFDPNFLSTGFVRFADGTLIKVNAPGIGNQGTFPYAINSFNEFTGYFYDANGAAHGFVALAIP